MEVLPLTPGLLASMMMRQNHAAFMPWFGDDTLMEMTIGRPETRIPKGIEKAIEMHRLALTGELADVQILEEVTGKGFYAVDHEEGYVAMLDQFPGMLALALDRIAAAGR